MNVPLGSHEIYGCHSGLLGGISMSYQYCALTQAVSTAIWPRKNTTTCAHTLLNFGKTTWSYRTHRLLVPPAPLFIVLHWFSALTPEVDALVYQRFIYGVSDTHDDFAISCTSAGEHTGFISLYR